MCSKMSENKDPAIKLFGKTIQLGSNSVGDSMVASRIEPSVAAGVGCECASSDDENVCCSKQGYSKQGKNSGNEICSTGEPMDNIQGEESNLSSGLGESKAPTTPSVITENSKTLSNDKYCTPQDLVQKEDHSDQTSSPQPQPQNPPKKPDEIIPCPRCNSMDTKFCYFNNYNVSQPRHFCKNCQRYWTAGGTMRNVPVGSGRRKNKSSCSSTQSGHLVTPEAPSELTHLALRPNSRVLSFESGASTTSKHGENAPSGENGFMRPEMGIPAPGGDLGNQGKGTSQGLIPPQMVCFPGSPWPYAWNPIPWQSGCPMPFYSASPQWACNPPAGSWNLHLLPNLSICPDPNSPFLGKHSRDGTMLVPSNFNNEEPITEKRLENPQISIPKTLRIVEDPIEVARSSVWGRLPMKKDKARSSNIGGRIFGGFHQYKGVNYHQISNAAGEGSHLVYQANPAAFSRSLSFHEVGQ